MTNRALDKILDKMDSDGVIHEHDLPRHLRRNHGYDSKSGLFMKRPNSNIYGITDIDIKDEYSLLSRLYRADPEHTAHPYALVVGNSLDGIKPVGYLLECITGKMLSSYLNENKNQSDSMKEALIDQIKGAVNAYHSRNLVHNDLYEKNIMITPDAGVKIIDPMPVKDGLDKKMEMALENMDVYKISKMIRGEPIDTKKFYNAKKELSKYMFK